MKSENKIETAGQLRQFLATTMRDLKAGTVDPDTASRVTKLAAQINESMYAEIKVLRISHELNQQVEKFGNLEIGPRAD